MVVVDDVFDIVVKVLTVLLLIVLAVDMVIWSITSSSNVSCSSSRRYICIIM